MAEKRHSLSNEERYQRDKKNQLSKLGVTIEHYNRMLEEQDGKCAICKGTDHDRCLAVDHDHVLGHIRMLLCSKCNMGIGLFNHSSILMQEAVEYLRSHGE